MCGLMKCSDSIQKVTKYGNSHLIKHCMYNEQYQMQQMIFPNIDDQRYHKDRWSLKSQPSVSVIV